MTGVDVGTAAHLRVEAAERNGGTPAEDDLRVVLSDLLGLTERGRHVEAAAIYGRGPKATVDLRLAGGEVIGFDSYADICNGTRLSAVLATTASVNQPFKSEDARRIACLVRWLAERHEEDAEDEALVELGREYRRVAPREVIDLDMQADRWRGFSLLSTRDPVREAGEHASALAVACQAPMLVDRASSVELIRTGWFRQYVRRELGGVYGPAQLATRMERLGWRRPGREGRIIARCPTDTARPPLIWTFYVVEHDWGTTP
jgi:hypothetical protein